MNSPLDGIDPVLQQPKRLAAMAVLAHSTATDFPFLKDHLQIGDSDLSKQMAALIAAEYVTSTRSRGRGSVTTYRITKAGRRAFAAHVTALEKLVSFG
ncbi:transcriptional regulator [Gordonia hydrophobica]|uniref:Transcriptional regulator n=1 Tax=Gordonia hydrophobica TaxID=40516 RepID=A0ABZ2U2L3_9ACTN|nr:transcriptional regulator [Gordonia hydrophobica]MBM7366913.1 DNA-binding MarR family transcriptional regulator [Gordonia hydrophobica]